jgi:hypothetical protein
MSSFLSLHCVAACRVSARRPSNFPLSCQSKVTKGKALEHQPFGRSCVDAVSLLGSEPLAPLNGCCPARPNGSLCIASLGATGALSRCEARPAGVAGVRGAPVGGVEERRALRQRAQHASLTDFVQLSERRERSERSEFCTSRNDRAPQSSPAKPDRIRRGRLSLAYVSLAKQRKVGRVSGRNPDAEYRVMNDFGKAALSNLSDALHFGCSVQTEVGERHFDTSVRTEVGAVRTERGRAALRQAQRERSVGQCERIAGTNAVVTRRSTPWIA